MTDEGEGGTHDQADEGAEPTRPADANAAVAVSPWEAFARPGSPSRVEPALPDTLGDDDEMPELGDDDEMPELGDEDEIDARDLTAPAAPIALRAASKPALPARADPAEPAGASPAAEPNLVTSPAAEPNLVASPAAESILVASSPAQPVLAASPAVETVVVASPAVDTAVAVPFVAPQAPYPYGGSPIFEVPHGARAALIHLPLAFGIGALGLGLAAGLADGGLGPFEPMVPVVCGFGILSGFVHVFASFPTILSAKPATKTLLISSGFAFGAAVLAGLFSSALRRIGSGASQLRAYPEFFCIAASFSAAAYLATAVVARRALRCLLLLRSAGDRVDEIADSRAMLTVVTGIGAAVLTSAIFLGLRLPLTLGLPAFMFMLVVGGAVARTQALAEGAALALDEGSPLRARLLPRIALAQHAYAACAFLGSFVLAMSIRIGMLRAISFTRYGTGAGVSAAAIDRALFVAIPCFTALATASFWVPKLALPRASSPAPLVTPRGFRVTVVLAVLSLGMLLRLEDAYDRRVSTARDQLVTKDERAREEETKDVP